MSSRISVPVHIVLLVPLTLTSFPLSIAQDSPQDYVAAPTRPVLRSVWVKSLGMSVSLAMLGITPKSMPGIARDWFTRVDHTGRTSRRASPDLTGTRAVNMWVGEKPYYSYNSNSCAPGKVCGHYTQVVWRNSVRLGCAKARCATGGTLITCNYDPPGNVVGQKPY
ncbi:SCP domain-containing protein [Psidium guajava]|nr:SCP domain-containing protein [Psidium guajava]